jgi:hypothetical protein
MKKPKSRALMLVVSVVILLASSWGASASWAQDHDDHGGGHGEDDHGDHGDGHDEDDDHGGHDPGEPTDPVPPPDLGDRPDAERTTAVQYGPYSLDPAPTNPDGTHGHAHSGNRIALNVEKPCDNCYITGMTADLVDQQGDTVGISDDVQLHHMVLFNQFDGRRDATCGTSFLGFLGQRFFASGDERTPIIAQPGYGYHVGSGNFNLIWELASMSTERETVFFQVTYQWIPEDEAGDMVDLEPVWLDIDQCGNSEVRVPAGQSMQSYTWNANRTGDIAGIGGHQHGNTQIGGGTNIEITNETTGEQICDSVAGYGEGPMYIDHHGYEWLSSMSTCGGYEDPDFRSPVNRGDRITIRSYYDHIEPDDHQMGIVIAYLAQEGDSDCGFLRRLLRLC